MVGIDTRLHDHTNAAALYAATSTIEQAMRDGTPLGEEVGG